MLNKYLQILLFTSVYIVFVNEKIVAQIVNDSIPDAPLGWINKKAPIFEGTSMTGNYWDSTKLQGKVILLSFWYPGCPACMYEIQYLNYLKNKYEGRDFQILSVCQKVRDDVEKFTDTIKNNKYAAIYKAFKVPMIQYEILPACNSNTTNYSKDTIVNGDRHITIAPDCFDIAADFNVIAYPTLFLIDKNGIIRFVKVGYEADVSFGVPTKPSKNIVETNDKLFKLGDTRPDQSLQELERMIKSLLNSDFKIKKEY